MHSSLTSAGQVWAGVCARNSTFQVSSSLVAFDYYYWLYKF